MDRAGMGMLHHIELWVPSLARAEASWGWLLGELGYKINGEWPEGKSWQAGTTYIVLEQSPARIVVRHDRLRPGLNHLAFYAASRGQVDSLWRYAPEHGWRLMFADRHPHAGGPDHYAAYLENQDGYEVEIVAPVFEAAEPVAGPSAAAAQPLAPPAAGDPSGPSTLTGPPGEIAAPGPATPADPMAPVDPAPRADPAVPAGQPGRPAPPTGPGPA